MWVAAVSRRWGLFSRNRIHFNGIVCILLVKYVISKLSGNIRYSVEGKEMHVRIHSSDGVRSRVHVRVMCGIRLGTPL